MTSLLFLWSQTVIPKEPISVLCRPVTLDTRQWFSSWIWFASYTNFLRVWCLTETSSSFASYTKLSKQFYGPFLIEEHVGPMAHRLQLPVNPKIRPMFHVSSLKPHHGPPPATPDSLPPMSTNNHPVVEPLQILEWQWDNETMPLTKLVLVQWTGEDTS